MSRGFSWYWYFVVVSLVSCFHAQGQTTAPFDTTFCITQTDRAFLSYYHASNGFDSIAVQYKVGELTLRNADTVVRLFQTAQTPYNEVIQHQGASVHQSRLDSLMRWNPVTVPHNAEMRFLRLVFNASSDRDGKWHIEDRTIFKLEARDIHTSELLWVVDSVMVDSGRTASEVEPSGTEVGTAYRSVRVPASLFGRTVFFAVSIDRYGTSPFGLDGSRVKTEYSMSLMYKANGEWRMNAQDRFDIERKRDQIWMSLADYSFRAACLLPNATTFTFSDGWLDTIHTHFYQHLPGSSKSRYTMKACVANPNTPFGIAPITIDDEVVGGNISLNTQIIDVDVDGYDVTVDIDRHGQPFTLALCVLQPGGLEQGGKVYRIIPVGEARLHLRVDKGTPKPWVILGRGIKGRTIFAFTVPGD